MTELFANMPEHALKEQLDPFGLYHPNHGSGLYQSVSPRATAVWKASGKKGGWLRDLTGNGHDARFGSSGDARLMGGLRGNDSYLRLPGVAGNYASVPDEVDLDITGDIDLRTKVAMDKWGPSSSQMLVTKDAVSGGQRSWEFYVETSGQLAFIWFPDGTATNLRKANSSALGLSNGESKYIRVALDADDGSGNWTVWFYTSDDGFTWTEISSATGTYATADRGILSTTAPLTFGGRGDGGAAPFAGRMYEGQVLDGIDGTTVLDIDFTNRTDGDTSFVASTGQTVTINSTDSADSNDPKLLEFDSVEGQYAYLPGVAGNYISTPDVNLLDADTAHLEKNSWTNWGGGSNSVSTAVAAKFGTQVLKVGKNTGDTSYARMPSPLTIAASTQYSASLWVYCSDTPTTGGLSVEQYDGTGTSLGSTSLVLFASQTGWQQLSGTFTSSASAASMRLYIRADDQPSDGFYIDAACFREGSTATFIPSSRIVGDVELRADVAPDDWTPGSHAYLINKNDFANERSYYWYVNATTPGTLRLTWAPDGTSTTLVVAESTAAVPATDGDRVQLRVTLDVDDGGVWRVKFYYRTDTSLGLDDSTGWTQLGSDVTGASTSLHAGIAPLHVGSSGADGQIGSIYAAQVYDGIDGPAVASFDAADASEPFDTVTGPYETWTFNRSSSGRKLAVVDRTMLLFGTDDYLEVANHPDLDVGAADDLTAIVVVRNYSAAVERIISKRDPANENIGWEITLGHVDANELHTVVDDGLNAAQANSPSSDPVATGTLATLTMRLDRTAATIESFVDAVEVAQASTSTIGSITTPTPLRVGRGSTYGNFEFVAAAVFRETLPTADLARLADELTKALS